MWEVALTQHPEQRFAQYILNGLEHGFRIGFQHGKAPLQQAGYNLQCPEPSIVSEYLSNELKLNCVIKLTKIEAKQMKVHSSSNTKEKQARKLEANCRSVSPGRKQCE